MALAVTARAQWQSLGNFDSYNMEDERTVLIRSGKSALRISVLTPDLFQIRLAPVGRFLPDSSWAVVKTDWRETRPTILVGATDLKIETTELKLVVSKNPVRLSFYDRNGHLLNEDDRRRGMSWDGEEVRVWKKMPPDENYYGFGAKAGKLNMKFKHVTMWNSDIPAYEADTDPLYQSIPFFYGVRKGRAYGIFFDNSYWSSFDMGKESTTRYSFGAAGGELNYYFFSGPAPRNILERFTELVGRMPLPPRWALGYQQCRWSYYPEARVRKLARDFRAKKIPCDVIYLDIDYMDGYRIFTWNEKNFPDPQKMIGDLAEDGFKIAVIVDPGIKADTAYDAYRTGLAGDHFLKYPDGNVYIGKVWPGECAFPDFSNPKTQEWWGDNFSSLTDVGVRGFWNDMNEPSVFDAPMKTVDLTVIHHDRGLKTPHTKNHNLYGMQMTQATYEGVKRLRPNERPFVLTRASFASGQRFSAAWTGDNIASWEHLQMAVSMCLNLSISGQPFVGSDIGGFIGSPDGELFARWLQLGVFTPLMRTHTVINSKDQEPWSFGKKFEAINRATIELRYRFLPYIYIAMQRASATGVPPMRPLIFDYPDEERYEWSREEFMFGDDLLIAPVLRAGDTTRSLKLPQGIWFDYWTGRRYEGGSDITVPAPLDRLPVLVKAGAILPTQQVVQYADQEPIDPLTLTLYPADFSESRYYEDDGNTFEYERGVYFERMMRQERSEKTVILRLSKAEGSYVPPKRSLVVKFLFLDAVPKSVKHRERVLTKRSLKELGTSTEGWSYESATKTVWVKMQDSIEEQMVVVER